MTTARPSGFAGTPVTGQEWTQRYGDAVMNTFGTPPRVLARGEGSSVWDVDGNRYLDLLGGIAVNALGHGHPAVVEAVTRQLTTLGHVSNLFISQPQVLLAERLLGLLGHDGRVFFANSGAEANEAAFKATRRTGRGRVVATEGSFHGRTMGALALTSKAAYREPFEPLPGGVSFVPYGDEVALAAAVDETVAAVIIEPIQGEAGVVDPPADYLRAARRITREHGTLLWLDEIQTGMGRTGDWFGHTASGVVPDLVTLAKGLGGGVPIGAMIGLGEAATLLGPGQHGTTFGGNPVSAAAALAVIDTIEGDGLLDHVRETGERLAAGLRSHPLVDHVSGRGLLRGVVLHRDVAAEVTSAAFDAGLLVNAPAPNRLRLAPPLVLTSDEADDAVATLRRLFDEVSG
ncbi:aminotransferase, acetylornithine/succinylornithine family [Aeromicrobium marinum DSM 15272]|uniref:Acetylornithine aminotransferase n=1 Tax=Aeromicrobium marinum DSM 15272 TaxID=585531 RepID=E2S9K1_9ACTN|nr:acetylornithine transaminase [Aeromicrobium marinum]EFQ83925.1 aminotransferase, acetylornithine/succinylornithine family [Aeromicrobium marinum DSM 15272]